MEALKLSAEHSNDKKIQKILAGLIIVLENEFPTVTSRT
jgi:hypothetical protein